MADLAELLERVKAATGPNFQLEQDIGEMLVPMRGPVHPPYTASLDAALALVERVLPGAEFELTNLYGIPMATLPMNMSLTLDQETARLEGGTLPLAVIAALLQALIAQGDVGSAYPNSERDV